MKSSEIKGNLEHLKPVRPKEGPKHTINATKIYLHSEDLDASSGFGTFAFGCNINCMQNFQVLEALEEFDENLSSWTIHRMKAGKGTGPLTAPASEIIDELQT